MEIFEALAMEDIRDVADLLRPVYDETDAVVFFDSDIRPSLPRFGLADPTDHLPMRPVPGVTRTAAWESGRNLHASGGSAPRAARLGGARTSTHSTLVRRRQTRRRKTKGPPRKRKVPFSRAYFPSHGPSKISAPFGGRAAFSGRSRGNRPNYARCRPTNVLGRNPRAASR